VTGLFVGADAIKGPADLSSKLSGFAAGPPVQQEQSRCSDSQDGAVLLPAPVRVQGRVDRAVGGVGPALASWSRPWTSSPRAGSAFPRAETTAEEIAAAGRRWHIRTWTAYSYRRVPDTRAVFLHS